MRKFLPLCSLVVLLASPQMATAGELKLEIANGRVTLIAEAVPIRTVLQEWARLGQSRIVNGEKVQGPPLTLQLIDVPEDQALDIVLRSASGYLAAPRAVAMANASRFDRIVILATSRPTSTAASAPPPQPQMPQMPQAFPAPPMMQQPVGDDQDESDEPRPEETPQMTAPGFANRPGPIQLTPPDPNSPLGAGQPPALPVTSPRPGLIQPPPQPLPQPPPPPARPIP